MYPESVGELQNSAGLFAYPVRPPSQDRQNAKALPQGHARARTAKLQGRHPERRAWRKWLLHRIG